MYIWLAANHPKGKAHPWLLSACGFEVEDLGTVDLIPAKDACIYALDSPHVNGVDFC